MQGQLLLGLRGLHFTRKRLIKLPPVEGCLGYPRPYNWRPKCVWPHRLRNEAMEQGHALTSLGSLVWQSDTVRGKVEVEASKQEQPSCSWRHLDFRRPDPTNQDQDVQWQTCPTRRIVQSLITTISSNDLWQRTNREFQQRTTATATRASPNKRFNERNNSYARAFWILVHFFAVLCETTTWNDQVPRILENASRNG